MKDPAPRAGLTGRAVVLAVIAVVAAAALTAVALLPGVGAAASRLGLSTLLTGPVARVAAALLLALAVAAVAARLLFDPLDRAAGLALDALQGPPADADDLSARSRERGDLRVAGARLSEWRHATRTAQAAQHKLEESARRVAAALDEAAAGQLTRIPSSEDDEEATRLLVRSADRLLESVRRLRDVSGVLLARIEDDQAGVQDPLRRAMERLSAGIDQLALCAARLDAARRIVTGNGEGPSAASDAREPGPAGGATAPPWDPAEVKTRLDEALKEMRSMQDLFNQIDAMLSRVERGAGRVGREINAARRRLGGPVETLTEADFVPSDSGHPPLEGPE